MALKVGDTVNVGSLFGGGLGKIFNAAGQFANAGGQILSSFGGGNNASAALGGKGLAGFLRRQKKRSGMSGGNNELAEADSLSSLQASAYPGGASVGPNQQFLTGLAQHQDRVNQAMQPAMGLGAYLQQLSPQQREQQILQSYQPVSLDQTLKAMSNNPLSSGIATSLTDLLKRSGRNFY